MGWINKDDWMDENCNGWEEMSKLIRGMYEKPRTMRIIEKTELIMPNLTKEVKQIVRLNDWDETVVYMN